jgi:hypothetical protein
LSARTGAFFVDPLIRRFYTKLLGNATQNQSRRIRLWLLRRAAKSGPSNVKQKRILSSSTAVVISFEMGRQLNQGLRLNQGEKTQKSKGGKHVILLSGQSFNLGTVYFTKWSKKEIWIPFYVWQK